MTSIRSFAPLALAALLAPAAVVAMSTAPAEDSKVTLSEVHLCCGSCVRAIDEATAPVKGVAVTCDRDLGTVLLVSDDVKLLQSALDAITDAGYHGTPDRDIVVVKEDSGATDSPVDSLTLTGVHNCCRGCAIAIEEALEEVEGIETVTAEPRTTTVTLSGSEINPLLTIAALNAAGFHVKVQED